MPTCLGLPWAEWERLAKGEKMSDLRRNHAGLSMGEFDFLSDEQKMFLKSLDLKTCDGYEIIPNGNSLDLYHEKADIYYLRGLKLKNPDYENEHREWLHKSFGENTFEHILLIEGDIVYFFLGEKSSQEGTRFELKGVVSKFFSDTDKPWLGKIIFECVRRTTAFGWEFIFYEKNNALYKLLK